MRSKCFLPFENTRISVLWTFSLNYYSVRVAKLSFFLRKKNILKEMFLKIKWNKTKSPTIESWNGSLKIIYVEKKLGGGASCHYFLPICNLYLFMTKAGG